MNEDATGSNGTREEALARALAAAHDALAAKIALIEAEQAAGTLARDLAAQQAAAAQAVYDRDCALARVEADTGWHTWAGVGGILYAPPGAHQPAEGGPRRQLRCPARGHRRGGLTSTAVITQRCRQFGWVVITKSRQSAAYVVPR